METIEVVGLTAAPLTTGSFPPQVTRLWRTRQTEGMSLLTFSIFSVGVALWLTYGIMLGATTVIIANVVTLVLAIAVVVLVARIRRQPRA
jgi:MtN3 and saliva related transmembrane protein